MHDSLHDNFPQSQVVEVKKYVLHEGTRFLKLGGYCISRGGNMRSVRVLETAPEVWKVEQQNTIRMNATFMRIGSFMDSILDKFLGMDLYQMPHYSPLLPHEQPGNLLVWADGGQKLHLFSDNCELVEKCEYAAQNTTTVSANRQWHVYHSHKR